MAQDWYCTEIVARGAHMEQTQAISKRAYKRILTWRLYSDETHKQPTIVAQKGAFMMS